MANPIVGTALRALGGVAKKRIVTPLKNRIASQLGPKSIKPGKTSMVKKAGDMTRNALGYVAAESVISAGYNKFKNRNKNQSVNSTDNMSTSGPIDRSIEKNK